MKWKLTCREAHRLISEDLDRELSQLERIRLKAHLFVCDACRTFLSQMNFIKRAVRTYLSFETYDEKSK